MKLQQHFAASNKKFTIHQAMKTDLGKFSFRRSVFFPHSPANQRKQACHKCKHTHAKMAKNEDCQSINLFHPFNSILILHINMSEQQGSLSFNMTPSRSARGLSRLSWSRYPKRGWVQGLWGTFLGLWVWNSKNRRKKNPTRAEPQKQILTNFIVSCLYTPDITLVSQIHNLRTVMPSAAVLHQFRFGRQLVIGRWAWL